MTLDVFVLFQHYPMFRQTDEMCDGPDAASEKEKSQWFKPRWDCISKESSDKVNTKKIRS